MRIIFCDSVLDNKRVEPDYEAELQAAQKAGFSTAVFSFEELNNSNINKAFRFVEPAPIEELVIYRGWMLKPTVYEQLYQELLSKNLRLINSPVAYKHCHYFPESYEKIKELTPLSSWTTGDEYKDQNHILKLTQRFGNSPVIVKDYVKSEKHHWKEACFIPDAQDKEQVLSVVNRFLDLRGDFLNEGLVFRKFEELEFLTNHSKSDMPLTKEFRLFFVNHQLLKVFPYWDEGVYDNILPELDIFQHIAQTIESNLFTMDIAQKKDGDWIIMELGDGQTAGLPENADKEDFYREFCKSLAG